MARKNWVAAAPGCKPRYVHTAKQGRGRCGICRQQILKGHEFVKMMDGKPMHAACQGALDIETRNGQSEPQRKERIEADKKAARKARALKRAEALERHKAPRVLTLEVSVDPNLESR